MASQLGSVSLNSKRPEVQKLIQVLKVKARTSDVWNQFLPRHITPWKMSQTRLQLTACSCSELHAAALLGVSLAGRAVQ